MKKTLSLILAVMMLLGCMSVTAFAEETDNTTDITLTVAKALTYDMVIPEDVTNLNAAGIYSVGQAKVTNVKNATDKTVISYTATTTDFTSEGKTDIPASYYTDAQGAAAFPTTAVEVYKNKADAASIPTMYVGITEANWNAAENGTYTATVTFNFEAKEVSELPATMTIAEILATVDGGFPTISPQNSKWCDANSNKAFVTADNKLYTVGNGGIPTTTTATKGDDGNYTTEPTVIFEDDNTKKTLTLTFEMSDNKLTKIISTKVDVDKNKGEEDTFTYTFTQQES